MVYSQKGKDKDLNRDRRDSGDSQTRGSQNTIVKNPKPFSLPSGGNDNLLKSVSLSAPSGLTAAESSSSSNPTKDRMKKDIESIKDKVKQAKEYASKRGHTKVVESIKDLMKKADEAYNAENEQEFQKSRDALEEVVNNFMEIEELLKQGEQQENARKEENNQQKWSGPTRASKISQAILDSKYFYLYRKMAREEADKISEKFKKTKAHKQQKALGEVTAEDKGRKWLTTTPEHSKTFSNENVDQGTNEVVIKITLDSKKYHKVLESRLPAYQSGSYENRNKDKVLIHQERLAESKIASTKNESELEKIFTEKENYNVGFSAQNVGEIDNAIKDIDIIEQKDMA